MPLATVETKPAESVSDAGAILNASIVSGGASVVERRFDWGTTPDCSAGPWTAKVNITGNNFSCQLEDLEPGTTYYFRASVKNKAGWSYGDSLSFTTQPVLKIYGDLPGGH
jgi:hypothetical protein